MKGRKKCIVAEGGYEFRAFIKMEDLKACLFTGGNEPGEGRIIDGGGGGGDN